MDHAQTPTNITASVYHQFTKLLSISKLASRPINLPMNSKKQRQAVVAIIRKSNKFLFVKRSDYIESAKGYWCPVSGGIEHKESQEEALKREVMEEVGLEVTPLERICGISSHDNNSFLNYWTVGIVSGEASITSNEATDLKWVTIEELKQLNPTFDEDIQIFEQLEYAQRND